MVTQPTQRGLQPEDWKGQRPNQQKRPREEASSRWISNEESPHCTGVTPQRPSTSAQPPPHCNSTALRVVTGVGQGFPVVVSFRLWVRKVGPWHSRWKSLPRDPKKGVGGVRDSRERVPKRVSDSRDRGLRSQRASKSSRPGLSNETGE